VPTPWPSVAIHGAVVTLWFVLLARAAMADSIFAWTVGLVYIAYDTLLIGFVFAQTLPLLKPQVVSKAIRSRPTLGILIAAHDEARVLPLTLRALFAQTEPADLIIIADDGSQDETATILTRDFGLAQPAIGAMSAASPLHPTLRWIRLPHGGKARALNAALGTIETELVLTVDGDTLLDPEAARAMRDAFAADASLVAATGVLTPICSGTLSGRFYQGFQTYEYIRNFLSRYAWGRMDALLLISGAFAGFRREPVLAVGGFDPACLVEDYELIHRLRRYGALQGLGWTTGVVGAAKAVTDAPSTTAAFLRQRRRWFCGFLQTQYWYRDMVGNPRYGRLGLVMLPVKALDTLQPVYGLLAFALLAFYLTTGRFSLAAPVGGVILGKIAIDFGFHLWSIHLYRRWVDPKTAARLDRAVLASLAEPFTFQILRHTGAALGWMDFLTRQSRWGKKSRLGLVEPREVVDGKA
jgi:cellulose synthase/poly-beta-1,6-N-acetylglucosamine synthase-like glycosyltransferase